MKIFLYNLDYFLKECRNIIKTNLISNIFSILSMGLIFFIFAVIISGWHLSGRIVETIKGEAEISIYFNEKLSSNDVGILSESIKKIDGINQIRLVGKDEALKRMEDILGKDARVLKLFNYNPFSPFFEINIDYDKTDNILKKLNEIKDIEYVRDNREILEKIQSISLTMHVLGYLFGAAAGISTVIAVSHIIKLGIHNNRQQINTLNLLGAPDSFIAFPYIIQGMFLTLAGGIISILLSILLIKYVYSAISSPLPFIPLPPFNETIKKLLLLIFILSFSLGIGGSFLGFCSEKNKA